MSAGGYIFRKVDLTYDPNTNGATVLDWAKAIHEARCQAFFDAAKAYYTSIGEPYGWYTLGQVGGYGTAYPLINLGSNPLFVTQDIHASTSTPANANYPALLTVFTDEVTGSYYCILTYTGYNSYSDYSSTPSYGLYLPDIFLTETSDYHVCCGGSLSHCYAKAGGLTVNPVNVKSSTFLVNNCTHIMAAYCPIYGYRSGYQTDPYSLLYDRITNGQNSSNLVGKTFQFGYAVKGEQIISMMRNSDSSVWLWSIIGDIFKPTLSNDDTCYVGCLVNDYNTANYSMGEVSSIQSPYILNAAYSYGRVSFCKSDGTLYRPVYNYEHADYSRSTGYTVYPCVRTNKSIPDDTVYNAVTVGTFTSTYNYSTGSTGIDGDCNGCKGFVDTDLLRMTSSGVCQTAGTTFNGNKFVAMKSPNSYSQVGFLLGWDSSNGSIL